MYILKFIFDWRTIALQYRAGFCHAVTWISHGYTYVPLSLNLPSTTHPTPLLSVVTEHRIWGPCVIQQISTGYLILHMVMSGPIIRKSKTNTIHWCIYMECRKMSLINVFWIFVFSSPEKISSVPSVLSQFQEQQPRFVISVNRNLLGDSCWKTYFFIM